MGRSYPDKRRFPRDGNKHVAGVLPPDRETEEHRRHASVSLLAAAGALDPVGQQRGSEVSQSRGAVRQDTEQGFAVAGGKCDMVVQMVDGVAEVGRQ